MKNRMLVAVMIEYRKATLELKNILSKVTENEFSKIRDFKTTDEDCKSIQTVVKHCISSGYVYANHIDSTTEDSSWKEHEDIIDNPFRASDALDEMLDYTETILRKISHFSDKELQQFQLKTRWHVTFDVEQLLEHAIVHILRHRLQIENFIKA